MRVCDRQGRHRGHTGARARGVSRRTGRGPRRCWPTASHQLASWDDIKLLSVTVDRLERWWKPGLLCIGDAAHAMSPVGGVGINLAMQDAVATANLLAGHWPTAALPARRLDAAAGARGKAPAVSDPRDAGRAGRDPEPCAGRRAGSGEHRPMALPWHMRLFNWFPVLRVLPAWAVGVGVRPEHVPIMSHEYHHNLLLRPTPGRHARARRRAVSRSSTSSN